MTMAQAISGDATISYQTAGDGPPVLLIAGTGYPATTWPRTMIDTLARQFTTIRYDHRGSGASNGTDGAYSTRVFAADAAAVIEVAALGPAHVIGHSMGGRVAQWLASEHSHLTRSLVLAASGPGAGAGVPHRPDSIPIRTVLRLMDVGYEGFIRELQRRTFFTDEFARLYPKAVDWLGDAFWRAHPSLEDYLKHVAARQTHDATAVLGGLTQRCLVVVGGADTHEGDTGSHVAQSQYLAAHIPGAELEVVPTLRHGLFWERPEATLSVVVDWLVELEASR